MVALSFGKYGNSIPPDGLSFGRAVLDKPAKVYSGRGSVGMPRKKVYSGRGSVGMPRRQSNPLTFGTSIPEQSVRRTLYGGSTPSAPLSFGGNTTGGRSFVGNPMSGGGLNHFLKTFSMALPSGSSDQSSAGLSAVPQIDTVTLDGGAGAGDAAKGLASSIFNDMLQPASMGGGTADTEGGGGFGGIGPVEIAIAAVAVGAVVLLAGGSSRRRGR